MELFKRLFFMKTAHQLKLESIILTTTRNFTWEKDGYGDPWTYNNYEKPFRDDCDGFSLAVIIGYVGGKFKAFLDLFRDKNVRIWRCITPRGTRHAIGEIRGDFFDNIEGGPHSWIYYENKGYTFRRPASKYEIFIKSLRGIFWH